MQTRDAARRWATTWARAWPARDAEAIVALQAEDGVHWASLFRPYRGRAGLRAYLAECFGEEVAPAETWFAEPWVDGDTAGVEYWAVTHLADGPCTVSGCTLLRFSPDGLVTEARDYSHVRPGRELPPVVLGPREPTSHERRFGRPWDASYTEARAPWDVDGPQPAVLSLAFEGPVLDAGCGTGENALHVASLGVPVLGIDVAATAVAEARAKAADRGLDAEFAAADAFALERLGRRFRTVLDCGLFHTCDPAERPRYVASLASVTEPGGTLYVLCLAPGPGAGPHPVPEPELRAAFATGWHVESVAPSRIRTRFLDENGAPAHLATITRL